jgi:hypothetical protein
MLQVFDSWSDRPKSGRPEQIFGKGIVIDQLTKVVISREEGTVVRRREREGEGGGGKRDGRPVVRLCSRGGGRGRKKGRSAGCSPMLAGRSKGRSK